MNDIESTVPQNIGKLWVRYIIHKNHITCSRS